MFIQVPQGSFYEAVSDSVDLERSLRFCIANKFLGDIEASGSRTTLCVASLVDEKN